MDLAWPCQTDRLVVDAPSGDHDDVWRTVSQRE